MQSTVVIVLLLLALASACGEPQCPGGYEKRGNTCYRIRRDGGGDASAADADAVLTPPTDCFLDWDHDGAGAGDAVDCELDLAVLYRSSSAADRPVLVERGGDCDDGDATRAPELAEACDGVDNDCDDAVDDDATNECGGPCDVVLEHAPGEACTNGSAGSCAREGSYVCQGPRAVRCDAAVVTPSQEVCGDQADNDCDGLVDEADGIDAPFWYQDCDGDGYAASATGAVRSCAMPPLRATCSWTAVLPQPETKTNWDCNDSSATYSPAADYGLPPAGSNNYDLNCDGRTEPDPNFSPAKPACKPLVVRFLNGEDVRCDISTFDVKSCYVWRTSTGAYARPEVSEPAQSIQLCPDAPYEVQVPLTPWGGEVCEARSTADSPVWPCR